MARDVHDLVGRELTVPAVRAEVLAVRVRREGNGDDFEELGETARRAHRMLDEIVVRRADERTSAPGFEGLPVLAREGERMGSPVGLPIEDEARGVSPPPQTAEYRVVQECLTHAAKHAPGEKASVRIGVEGPRLRIEVRNPPADVGPVRQPVSSGTGTPSMRERVEGMGGTLTAGARDGAYCNGRCCRRGCGAGRSARAGGLRGTAHARAGPRSGCRRGSVDCQA